MVPAYFEILRKTLVKCAFQQVFNFLKVQRLNLRVRLGSFERFVLKIHRRGIKRLNKAGLLLFVFYYL